MGSFITPDPAMDGINHYAYANSNPIKYTDPTGLFSVNWDNWTPGHVGDIVSDNDGETDYMESHYGAEGFGTGGTTDTGSSSSTTSNQNTQQNNSNTNATQVGIFSNEYEARFLMGETTDGHTFSYMAPLDDEKKMGTLQNIRNNMLDLGWTITITDVMVKECVFGNKYEIQGIKDPDNPGEWLDGEFSDFAEGAMIDNFAPPFAKITYAVYEMAKLGKDFYDYMGSMEAVMDGSAQLQYLLTTSRGADTINSLADYFGGIDVSTLSGAKEAVMGSQIVDPGVFAHTVLIPSVKMYVKGIAFTYW